VVFVFMLDSLRGRKPIAIPLDNFASRSAGTAAGEQHGESGWRNNFQKIFSNDINYSCKAVR
jgi:hypothetical protein